MSNRIRTAARLIQGLTIYLLPALAAGQSNDRASVTAPPLGLVAFSEGRPTAMYRLDALRRPEKQSRRNLAGLFRTVIAF